MGGRIAAFVLATVVAVAGCTGAPSVAERSSDNPSLAASARAARPSKPPTATAAPVSERARIVRAYRRYTDALNAALQRGGTSDGALSDHAAGEALADARARVAANAEAGVAVTGALEPSATADQVAWDGGDDATITDCVLNGLAHVDADDPGAVVAEATGTRRPVSADLVRSAGGWIVNDVRMPQEADIENPQPDPPYLRGPMPDGPPSCAPPELEQEILAGYRAFWDAFDRAFGFGRDGPANPDDPALAATSVDPQLSDTKAFLEELAARNVTSVGERDKRDPSVLAVIDYDTTAIVTDCVELGASMTVSTEDGSVAEVNDAGRLDYEQTRMTFSLNQWRAENWDTVAEGVGECSG